MEPVRSWGPAQAAAWLRGLDAAVQGYPFEAWGLSGPDVLGLDAGVLEALGVRPLGHQELLLEAVEQLRNLDAGLANTSLRTLTKRLQELAQGIQSLVQGGLPAGDAPQPPSLTLLARVIDLVGAAKELFSWLNRYLFSTLNDFSASQDIILLCAQLAETLQADLPAAERNSGILQTCQHIVGICESIVGCSPPALLDRRAVLQRVGLALLPGPQGSPPLCCLHFVSATTSEALAAHGGHVLPGDEIVQVNEQVVLTQDLQVGWTPVNLARKLLEKGNRVTLVLKKIPLDLPSSPPSPRQQVSDPSAPRASGSSAAQGSRFPPSVAADLDSGPDSVPDPVTDEEQEEDERDLRLPGAAVEELPGPCGQAQLSLKPHLSPRPGQPQHGTQTERLSRRRVSCRDLGRVDCEGWLLKKKDHVGFMAHKWKRCWFVLKGHTLYWYNHPNDERAAGLINVATYSLESTREQKKKYVFQLCHQTYKPFVFAAETLADLSMWVSRLVTAKTKYTLAHQAVPDKEEDCYSETEAEDPDDESPRHGSDSPRKRLQNTPEKAQLSPGSSPQGSPRPCSPMEAGGEDLESLVRCLRQGGVSLLGQRRVQTQEQGRKSFLRRNRNPHINDRVHAVRALQSTLKAKLAELQALEQLLGEAALTSDTFRRWKEEHQELYQELREGWAGQQGQGHQQEGAGDQQSPHGGAAEP
ncbi:CNKR1 kinase, partial [Urocynchramus pylzowi]|nr:CNKR1 kinase [Urocynchramus pylzowi]